MIKCLVYDTPKVEKDGLSGYSTTEYDEWLKAQPLKSAVQIEKRISNIETDDHFGTINDVGDDVWELKWQNGRRV